jgi:hypothetical protein
MFFTCHGVVVKNLFDLKEVVGSKFRFLSLTKLQFSLIKLENQTQV